MPELYDRRLGNVALIRWRRIYFLLATRNALRKQTCQTALARNQCVGILTRDEGHGPVMRRCWRPAADRFSHMCAPCWNRTLREARETLVRPGDDR